MGVFFGFQFQIIEIVRFNSLDDGLNLLCELAVIVEQEAVVQIPGIIAQDLPEDVQVAIAVPITGTGVTIVMDQTEKSGVQQRRCMTNT